VNVLEAFAQQPGQVLYFMDYSEVRPKNPKKPQLGFIGLVIQQVDRETFDFDRYETMEPVFRENSKVPRIRTIRAS
jgi:hypothetical protein